MHTASPESILPPETIERDAQRVFDVLVHGGTAIIYLDVAYAILGRSAESVRRIYTAKSRSFGRPTGIVGALELHDAIHLMDDRAKAIVRAVTVKHDLPLSVIAPYRENHAFLCNLDPFVLGNAIKNGTLNLLLNAGKLRTAVSRISFAAMTPLVGTSANVSLTGSKFRVEDIEPAMLAAADIVIDYGRARYHNPHARSSTMIDFRDLSVVREGVCFERIRDVIRDEFDIELRKKVA
jgi:tRNA A37 threonylcarbamoyladenosine synthetase subunit TsaC/SUA5/YrdC